MFCKSFKIDKELYHVTNAIMHKNKEESIFFSHNRPYNALEHGRNLNAIIERVGRHIENLASLRAMIDIAFETTKPYFIKKQIYYTLFVTIPFTTAIMFLPEHSNWLLPILTIS